MKKLVTTLLGLIITLNLFSQVINNSDIKFILAADNLQEHNKPIRFYIEFKVAKTAPSTEEFGGILYLEGLVYKANNNFNSLTDIDYYTQVFGGSTKQTVNGEDIYTYRSSLIDLDESVFKGDYPLGSYKFAIVGRLWNKRPAVNFDSNGDPITGITNGVLLFDINDICTNCNNGIFISEDSDSDGIVDSIDNCPNIANPNQKDIDDDGIGDVCDSQDNRPDLIMETSNVILYSNCGGGCKNPLSNLGSNKHLFDTGASQLNINMIIIDNIGGGSSPSSKVSFYVSEDKVLSSDDKKLSDISIASIKANNSKGISNTIFASNFGYGFKNGNYYILVKVDADDIFDELDDGNNQIEIPISFSATSSSKFNNLDPQLKTTNVENNNESYIIEIYTFGYVKIFEKLISSKEEEETIIKNLQQGLYIINTNNSSRKVYVD